MFFILTVAVLAIVAYYFLRRTAPKITKEDLMQALSKYPKQYQREGCEKAQPVYHLSENDNKAICKAFEPGLDMQYVSLNNYKNICGTVCEFAVGSRIRTGLKYGQVLELRDEQTGKIQGIIVVSEPEHPFSFLQSLIGFELKIPFFWSKRARREGWGSKVSVKLNSVGNKILNKHKQLLSGRKHWYVEILGVAEGAQGKGVGTKLLDCVKAFAFESGDPVYLECHDNNVGYYQKQGFKLIHTQNMKPKHKDITEGLNINFMLYENPHKNKDD
ncbi:gnat family acetyltransferase [Anaeramoeba flamelloides]|uniref:Gnat family acetyltransferase n=1 Tax=Anaeramoeba flamelloides TaxID=1746091 RepID=A0AAV8A5X8_9EUKA|nr:gnat family acetyltransferase [Anaeramoeba flamelloides]|eukprot:Anaeramoba_flamelloidesa344814_68.p1 GENE.a344814_68~~a344814_68.p1  ORF type:complete len:273 (-),score=29.64 a344814_68:89-907(-)